MPTIFHSSLLYVMILSAILAPRILLANKWVNNGQWYDGRATFYGTDAWSIHKGSCQYGYLDPDIGTGWMVTALGDMNNDYIGSCGRCYQIKCRQASFSDGYGEKLDRTSVCRDEKASVIVQVTDTCACYYKNNAFSNKRWCCGDMQHFDLSTWASEKLAEQKNGVIGIRFREVPCDYKPSKWAYCPNPTEIGHYKGHKPWNWDKSQDKRYNNWDGYKWQNGIKSSSNNWFESGNGRKLSRVDGGWSTDGLQLTVGT